MSNDTYTMSYPCIRLPDNTLSLKNRDCYMNFKNYKVVDRCDIDEIYLIIKDRASLIDKIIISNINNISDIDLRYMKKRLTSIKEVKEIIFI